MQRIKNDHLSQMPSRYRAQLINSISGFKSASLIGTCDAENVRNLAIFSSVIHLGSNPAYIGFISRPDSVKRHTLNNIKRTQQFTINHVSEDFWQAAHQTSAKYLESECEFSQTGLNPQYIEGVLPPFVEESQLKYALKLTDIMSISHNNTYLVVGEVTDILCAEEAIKADGYIDIESLHTVTITGLDSYHRTQRLSRLTYATPSHPVSTLNLNGELADDS